MVRGGQLKLEAVEHMREQVLAASREQGLLAATEKGFSQLAVSIDFSLAFSGQASVRHHTILFVFAGYNSVGLGSILRVAGEKPF